MSNPRALIVEDEAPIRNGLVDLFEQQDFTVTGVASGTAALDALSRGVFDIVLLDLMIPEVDGLEVLRRVRARGDRTPVLVLTAKGAEDDVVAGIEAGADDYVAKPFGIRELLARARGLLRRPRPESTPQHVEVDGVSIDFGHHEVRASDARIELSAREASLLQYLWLRQGNTVTREVLLVDVWGYRDGRVMTRTVDVHVQQLRKKLGQIPRAEAWIQTVRGRGYRFEPGSS